MIRRDGRPFAPSSIAARALLACLALASACGGGGDSTRAPEVFTGTVDEFYVVPADLPTGEPGELIRVQPISSDAESTTLRIMYHSRDAQGRDRAVTGILTHPNEAPPEGGWPVVTLGNGTVGLRSQCALSRRGNPAPTFGVVGVGVVTDYVGLGPVGEIHPYLSRPSEGQSMIDAVRAARALPDAGAGSRWLAIGHSQGGHAALSTHELAASYAPEVELLGTVSLAPAAMFDRTYGVLDEIVTRIVGVMGLYGAASEHPEIDPDDYVGPATAAASAVFETGCLDDIIDAFVTIPAEEFWIADPVETEPARSIILENDVGNVRVDAPLLLVGGTADDRVVVERVRDLLGRLCSVGQVTEYLEIEGANHGNEYALAADRIEAFFAERLTGSSATDSCDAGS